MDNTNSAVDQRFLDLTSLMLDTIPQTLKDIPSWILWQPHPGKTKIIKKPLGGTAWQESAKSYEDALTMYTTHQASYPTGLGIVYTKEHPLICVDIDEQTPDNIKLQAELSSYTERSPSGVGTHVYVRLMSLEDKLKVLQDFGSKKFDKTNGRDLFISNGYTTITGDRVEDKPKDVRFMSYTDLSSILSRYFNIKLVSLIPETKTVTVGVGKHQQKLKVLTSEQVRLLLRKIDVRTLTSDIFELLSHPIKLAILNPEEREEAREPWLIICQAVHHNFSGGPDGLLLLHEWSKKGNKYDKAALMDVYASFSTAPQFLNQRKPITIATLIALVRAQQPDFSDRNNAGNPIATIQNLETYLRFYKYQMKYNIISMQVETTMPAVVMEPLSYPTNQINDIDTVHRILNSELLKLSFNMKGFVSLRESLIDFAKINTYNPVEKYFNSLLEIYDPTQDPLTALMATIKPETGFNSDRIFRALTLFVRKWLIQVVAAANTSVQYSDRVFNNILVFTGDQGVGKTKWVSSIFPKAIRHYCAGAGTLQVNQFKSDNVKQAMELQATLICNINEIDVLFKPKNYSAFKQLLDENTSRMVLPYGRVATTLTRRTVFIGSTNKRDFLVDTTGNRRITILPIDRLIYEHKVDIEQLWAHVMQWYKSGEKWWLEDTTAAEKEAKLVQHQINTLNMYIGDEFFLEDLDTYFDLGAKSIHYKEMTFKDVRTCIPSLMQAQTNGKMFNAAKLAFIQWLKQTKFGKVLPKAKTIRAAQFYRVPPLRTEQSKASFRQVAAENAAKKALEETPTPI